MELSIPQLPKMILFDYGEALIHEQGFDGIKGTEAVLNHSHKNKYYRTAAEVQTVANELNGILGRDKKETLKNY